MKRFAFRLERILALRARAERQRARELGAALRDEEARREAAREALARLQRCGEQAATAAGQVTPAGTLHAIGLALRAAAETMEAATDSHRAAEAALAAETERFGRARRERRVVERLRERRAAAWGQEVARAEQQEMDGLAQRRPAREDAS